MNPKSGIDGRTPPNKLSVQLQKCQNKYLKQESVSCHNALITLREEIFAGRNFRKFAPNTQN